MKTYLLFITYFLLVHINLIGQDCKAFVPYEVGTKAEVTTYDKKGKVIGTSQSELMDVQETEDTTKYIVHYKGFDKDGKLQYESDFNYKCINGEFIMDMSSFMSSEQMDAYKDMEVKVSTEQIYIPSNYKVGEILNDGFIKFNISGNSPVNMDFKVTVENRKVEAVESVDTPAGKFNCVKISQDVVTKSIMSFTMPSVEWYAEGVGNVKSESYRKGKLVGYTELTKFEKP